ncbi:MAG TPA: hypothetical protein VGH73_22000 [Thermoanaerobaculia bacterium]|jgi:hypothetical protein
MSVSETSNTLRSEPTSEALQGRYECQVGPGISGKGSVSISTEGRSVLIFFSPSVDSLARVLYNINSARPDKPLKPRQELRIDGAHNVYLDYSTDPGGDLKLAWRLL